MVSKAPDAKLQEAWDLVRIYGSVAAAARGEGIPQQTLSKQFQNAMTRLALPDPRAVEPAFIAPAVPKKERSLEELLSYKRKAAKRVLTHDNAVKLIRIKLKTPGPLGFMIFGDPHIDNEGCDFNLLESHLKIAKSRPDTIFAGNIGDIRDNWIGRLAMLAWGNAMSAPETWKMAQWLMRYIHWCWLIRGNHDCWSGDNDPLDWIMGLGPLNVDQPHGVRMEFIHPNGAKTRVHARHDFPGRSIYNANHGLGREARFGFRDHIIVAGHLHFGMDSAEVVADQLIQMVRVSGYKRNDSYRQAKGFHQSNIHAAALIIVDPDQPDDSRSRVWCAPSVEEGADWLDHRRRKWEKSK